MPSLESDAQLIVAKFGSTFPSTKEMSAFAREQVSGIDALAQPDAAVVAWIIREEALFKALEATQAEQFLFGELAPVVSREQIRAIFDFDKLMVYFKGLQQRRRARMGYALQNHLAHLWSIHGIAYTPQANMGGVRIDFIFSDLQSYHRPAFDRDLLTVLAVKSVLRERWTEVLREGAGLKERYLCTIDPKMPKGPVAGLSAAGFTLVVLSTIQANYRLSASEAIISVQEFIARLRDKQNRGAGS